MALFYFVRHGETAWNAEERLCGSTDVPLSDVGRRQAHLLGLRFQPIWVEALYSSPLGRALETAQLIGEAIGREPVVDPRLAELNYGAWEGRLFEEIKRTSPAIYGAWDADPANVAPPEGETGVHLIERVTPFMADLAQRHRSGNVVVVCHKTVCRLLACHIMGTPLSEYRRRITMDNAAVNIFETREGKWGVVALNDTSHLSTPAAEPTAAGDARAC
jgi:broad specificity phosphatase PhoE